MSVVGGSVRIVTGCLVLMAVLPAMAGVAGGRIPQEERIDVPVRSRADLPHFRPSYVAGEVVVKLRDVPGGIQILSEDAVVRGDEATLRRLEANYGLKSRGPVFQRVHEQARRGPLRQRIGVASAERSDAAIRRSLAMLRFYVLQTDRDVRAVCADLNADPAVEYAQPNYRYYPCRTPDDPDFPDQYAHQLIQMENAWGISTGSRDVVIAVIDTGVDVDHPDLKDNIWVNPGDIPDNGIDDDGNGYIDDIHGWNFGDDNNKVSPTSALGMTGHGTQVAGVIGAVGNNGIGVAGVNWECSIMVLRLSLDFGSAEIAAALDYAAANGAHVVNMSFGADSFGPEADRVIKAAIDNAYEQGVLLVASAGNSDTSRPMYPAALPNVMAVSSTNGEDMKTGHSTFGLWVDIAAPGTDIVTTDLGDRYIATAGTSFSAPYVAAVAALVLSHRPELTHVEVRAILENTTDPVDYGYVDPDRGYLGTGRVNAYQALLAADRRRPLGEITSPMPHQTFAPEDGPLDVALFVHGDAYELGLREYGQDEWTPLGEGGPAAEPAGLVNLSLASPGVGTYELRLRVHSDGYTHTDRKLFGVRMASPQEHWPKPDETVSLEARWETFFLGSPICMDVDGDGTKEIIQSSLRFDDYWGTGRVNIWRADGNSLPNWPVEFEYFWPTSVAVGDIDGDGDFEVVIASMIDNEMYAYHVESGKIVEGEWPVRFGSWFGYVSAGPILADLEGNGVSDIIIALDSDSSHDGGLFAFRGDGSLLWERRYTSEGPITVADFNGDGTVQIALCGYGAGLSRVHTFILDARGQQIARWRGGSPKGTVVADLNGDGRMELIFCTDREVMAVHSDGNVLWSTLVADPLDMLGAISVGDVNDDGFLEVYVTSLVIADGFAFTCVYVFDHTGRPLTEAGFPKTIMGSASSSEVLIADLDGDGHKEMIVGAGAEPLMAWKADGSLVPGFPMLHLAAEYDMTPALADLDGDGDLELMVAGDDYRFHVLDLPAPYDPDRIDWGMFRLDPQNSGWFTPAPRLDPFTIPSEIHPGQRLDVQLTASNPADRPLHWRVGNLPQGASFDPQTQTLLWKPAINQVFERHSFSFLVTDGIRQDNRRVAISVVPDAIYYTNMNTDPGWQFDESWAWGVPEGRGSWHGDPNSGRTGENVIGYTLDGDYENNLSETRYATTPAIDCTGYENIRLSFWRWLGVEAPYDYACIQVSNDGVTWTDLWTTGWSHISDGAWQFVEYAVPAGIADNQPTVYFRWGLGPTDALVTAPGWNIDDVQVMGDPKN